MNRPRKLNERLQRVAFVAGVYALPAAVLAVGSSRTEATEYAVLVAPVILLAVVAAWSAP